MTRIADLLSVVLAAGLCLSWSADLASWTAGPARRDVEAKPSNIALHIGARPIFAAGNSDGDLQMLHYATSGPGRRMALIVRHDDAAREYAYDRRSKIGALDAALDEAARQGWTVVSMKSDWRTVFPVEATAQSAGR